MSPLSLQSSVTVSPVSPHPTDQLRLHQTKKAQSEEEGVLAKRLFFSFLADPEAEEDMKNMPLSAGDESGLQVHFRIIAVHFFCVFYRSV